MGGTPVRMLLNLGSGYDNYTSGWEADNPEAPTNEIKQHNYWLQIAYIFVDNWEAYRRLGLADAGVFGYHFPSPLGKRVRVRGKTKAPVAQLDRATDF